MANEIATTDRVHGPRDLAALALNPSLWTTRPTDDHISATDITTAIEGLRSSLQSVPRDPAGKAEWEMALDTRVRRLAVKIAPGMATAPADEWRRAMVEALSDLPAMVALTAAKKAIHRPMQFLNEVEGVVRELAAEIMVARRAGILRLEDLARQIAEAAMRDHALPAPDSAAPITAEEIRGMSPWIRNMGLSNGWITQDEIDAAMVDTSERTENAKAGA